jgi:hypothetical protein
VAFADDLILAIRGDSVSAVESYSNGELSKIAAWSKSNKIRFNYEKSKAMLVSRRKRREPEVIKVYLNNKVLEQVTKMKYLGIIIDHKFSFKEHIGYREMHKNDSQPIQIGQSNMGNQALSSEDYIQRCHPSSPAL